MLLIACLVLVSGFAMVLVSKLVDDLPLETDLGASLSLFWITSYMSFLS